LNNFFDINLRETLSKCGDNRYYDNDNPLGHKKALNDWNDRKVPGLIIIRRDNKNFFMAYQNNA
jgi:hypothetical protein